jgi:predicted exporter
MYSQAFERYRILGSWSLVIAACIGCVMVTLIYRHIRAGLIVLCPCIAVLGGIFIPTIFGIPYSFFSIAAGMVLFGIGVDYAAFLWEAREKQENWTPTAVLIGAITTLLSMGLLMTSATFPVKSFGMTVAIGTLCAFTYSLVFIGHINLGTKEASDEKL